MTARGTTAALEAGKRGARVLRGMFRAESPVDYYDREQSPRTPDK